MRSATNSKSRSGREENDLPLDALVRIIERETLAALGVTALPPPLVPVDFLLL